MKRPAATGTLRSFDVAARVSQAMADRTRLRLLYLLLEGEVSVGVLCARTKLPQPGVSHHLGILRRVGLVLCRRVGKSVLYRLAHAPAGDGVLRVSRDGLTVTVSPRAEHDRR